LTCCVGHLLTLRSNPDVVRYCSKDAESLGTYLRKLWSHRTVVEAYRIQAPEDTVLNKLLDTRAFPARKNDVFLICKTTPEDPEEIFETHARAGTSRNK
jgi:hypothetical protein